MRPWRHVRAAARTASFVLNVLPMLPDSPLSLVASRPRVERVRYPTREGVAEGDLYRPAHRRNAPAVLVCLGVVPFGVEHPQVARLGRALARSGLAALLYWSPAMRDRRLDPDDAEGIGLAYRWLIDLPGIDPSPSGLLGTCVGGTFALLASADPEVRDRVAFVAAFAPYSSMWTLARDIAGASVERGERRVPWEVDPLTREVFVRSLLAALELPEAELVRAALESVERGEAGGDAMPPLSSEGDAVARLLTAGDVTEASAALDGLPASMRARLDALSPLERLADVRAPLLVIGHDRDDPVIPVTESRQLTSALAGRPGVRYTEFALFRHATPRSLPVLPLARELARFYRYVYPMFLATS